MAGVASTRRVGTSSTTVRPVKGYSPASGGAEGFVEAIDASNRISAQAYAEDERKKGRPEQHEIVEENEISTDLAYVKRAIEALAASGVYDEAELENRMQTTTRVNVYDNNQTLINREEAQESKQKTFFEEDITEEIDEFV